MEETAFGLPSLGDRSSIILRPLPIDPAIERIGQLADFGLLAAAVEIAAGHEHARQQQGRVDERQFALPDAASRLHVQEMIIKTLVAGGVGLLALRAAPERLQR